MTIWYCDYEGGMDATCSVGNGDSFATRRKKLDNFSGAAMADGDTIRVMASPDPVSIGSATWTGNAMPDAKSIVSSTNATPISVQVTGHGYSTGMTVVITGHTTNTKANGVWEITVVDADNFTLDGSVGNGTGGATGTVRDITSAVVRLPSALTANVACNGNQGTLTNWTASANVTCSLSTSTFKEGGESQQIAVATGFTTGKAAYLATGTLNLSGYTGLSFWIQQSSGTVGADGAISLALCSDTDGATPVNTINIPTLGTTNSFMAVHVDTGAALGSAIQSIALYVNTDNGAQTFQLDNIVACNGLSVASLLGKNTGDEPWFQIQSINGTRVMLDVLTSALPAAVRGYYGTSESVTTYRRECTETVASAASGTYVQTVAVNNVSILGGWNRTDMSTQTGETWFSGKKGTGGAISDAGTTRTGVYLDKINAVRYHTAYLFQGINSQVSFGTARVYGCSNFMAVSIPPVFADVLESINALSLGTLSAGSVVGKVVSYGGAIATAHNIEVGELYTYNSATTGINIAANNNISINYFVAEGCTSYGVSCTTGSTKILGGHTSGNLTGGITNVRGKIQLRDFSIGEATEVAAPAAFADARVYSEKHDGTANNSQIFCDGGLISKQNSVVHGSANYAWRFSPTSTNRSATYPLNEVIARVACAASSLVTVSAWFRRDNTGLTASLVCKGKQIAGVSADVTASMTAGADTWEELTITFTPNEAGVVEIEAQFYGGSTYNGYVSDMTVGQA